jgi:hypothetical protein
MKLLIKTLKRLKFNKKKNKKIEYLFINPLIINNYAIYRTNV